MNRLSNTTSPYLLQHANNPVDWHPWDEEALATGQSREQTHLPEHRLCGLSLVSCDGARILRRPGNRRADERALHQHQSGPRGTSRPGQHLHVRHPGDDRFRRLAYVGLPDTRSATVLRRHLLPPGLSLQYTLFPRCAAPPWQTPGRTEPEKAVDSAQRITAHIQSQTSLSRYELALKPEHLDTAVKFLLEGYDWGYGGWGDAPKFPQPMTIEFLLRRHIAGDTDALKPAIHALQAMARGGMYDVVGGGFSRYSVDNFWRVPHFEKMLYDNAQLVRAYLHAWQVTGEPEFKRIVRETLDFVAREMTHPEGGFYSSLDADSEGEEGKFYVWEAEEIKTVLGDDYNLFQTAYGITENGNWEGKTVLQRAIDNATLAARFSITPQAATAKLAECHTKLLTVRAERIRPGTDDKVLTAWNGLMLAAIAEAARVFEGTEEGKQYHNMATRSGEFLLTALRPDGHLRRSWRDGKVTEEVFLEDYAALILGLLELYQTDFNNRWFASALELADEMIERFSDPDGGFFDTPADGESLVIRPKDLQDNATPSGNALACEALLKLAAFTDNGAYRDLAEKSLKSIAEAAVRYPTAFARWLSAADFALGNVKQVAVLGDAGEKSFEELIQVIRSEFRPNVVVAASPYPPAKAAPALLAERPLVNGKPSAYVCEGFVCKQPVGTAEALRQQLS